MSTQTQTTAADLDVLASAAEHACEFLDAGEPAEALVLGRRAAEDAEQIIAVAVSEARVQGMPWEQIGATLGMTKQGVQQRYGRT